VIQKLIKYNPEKHVYFISYSKLPANISAAVYEGYVGVGFIINYHTGIIEDVSCTLLTDVARNFLKSIIVGYSINDDVEPLLAKVNLKFHGHSQKSVCVIIQENFSQYEEWANKNKKELDFKKKNCYNDLSLENDFVEKLKSTLYPEHSIYLLDSTSVLQKA